ncbi:hypothetical protein OG455_13375 [Kitasatospora sp. NBC_01287]|uniref:trypsin-like serine peptidase n=1 Tax=Kitasatospora sp. NBC_01287 TaxID=2903573 RepID=UPI00225791EC|nr:hypothetical protein [Kitasatospora sp. NBC_01287]MCX4746504.1 hypothetical protein [Kitasatospora sp. NBC_01287]
MTGRPARTPRATAVRLPIAAALAAALALTAGCGSGAGRGGDPRALPGLPDLRGWSSADWSRWAQQHLLHNEIARDLWSPAAMKAPAAPGTAAAAPSPSAVPAPARTGSDPLPGPVPARPVPHPYPADLAVFGRLLAKSPQGTYTCSGTVVSDPAHPGKSNLVWTAGHCLHGGKGGDWLKNIAFVPDYNSAGAAGGGRSATLAQVAPLGRWWADHAMVAPQWMAEGSDAAGGAVSQYDSGIIRVTDPDLPGTSLEEAVGGSVPIWFDAPRERIGAVTAYGFPALQPFDGQQLDSCAGGGPGRLSYDPTRPAMLTIGCTMTAGASGGGWLATGPDGRPALVSNTSIGPSPASWVAGPQLDDQARQMFTAMTELP